MGTPFTKKKTLDGDAKGHFSSRRSMELSRVRRRQGMIGFASPPPLKSSAGASTSPTHDWTFPTWANFLPLGIALCRFQPTPNIELGEQKGQFPKQLRF